MGTAAARSWNWRISANCQHPCRISRFVREYSLGTLVQFTVEGAASLAHPHQQTKFCCTYVLARYLRALLSCLSRNSKTQGGRGQDRARNTGREVGEIARACARSEPMRECLSGTGEVAGERREGEERTQGGRGENAAPEDVGELCRRGACHPRRLWSLEGSLSSRSR